MRVLVKLVMVMVAGFVGLMMLIAVGSIFLAVLLPTLAGAIPELGRELGYYSNVPGSMPVTAMWVNLLPLFGFALMLLLCLCVVAFTMRVVGREPSRARSKEAVDETRLIQELYHGMSRMEQRVEALETLLLERVPTSHIQTATEPSRRTVAR